MPSETEPLVREVRIEAARETVFAYLTDPTRMTEWFGRSATLDPRPGGIYRVELGEQDTARGEFVEVDPPHRAVFTFGWEHGEQVPPGASTVEITLTEDGETTLLRLTHSGLPGQSVEKHGEGWTHHLGQLVALFGSDERRPAV